MYDFVGWLATHLHPNKPYSRQANGQFGDEAAREVWILGHHAVVKIADFVLIDRFDRLALPGTRADMLVRAMPVFLRFFQPD